MQVYLLEHCQTVLISTYRESIKCTFCCAKRTSLLEAHWLTPSSVHLLAAAAAILQQKGVPRKVLTSGLRGDIVRFAQHVLQDEFLRVQCVIDTFIFSL